MKLLNFLQLMSNSFNTECQLSIQSSEFAPPPPPPQEIKFGPRPLGPRGETHGGGGTSFRRWDSHFAWNSKNTTV